jgi:hypothetical protein
MNGAKLCKNKNCSNIVELDRSKKAKYCKACGANRSKDWKREYPERTKLYANEDAVRNWRDRTNWNQYIRDWRERNREKSREQTRRAVRAYRKRKRRNKEITLSCASLDGLDEKSSHQSFENTSPTSQYFAQAAFKETRTSEPIVEMVFRLRENAAAARHRRWLEIALASILGVITATTATVCLYVSFSNRYTIEEKKTASSIIQFIVAGVIGFLTGKSMTKNNSPPSE